MKVEDLTIKQIVIACNAVNGDCVLCNPSIFAFCSRKLQGTPKCWQEKVLKKDILNWHKEE